MDREAFGWALVLSVPPGVGVVSAFAVQSGAALSTGIAAGVLTAAAVFLLVWAATRGRDDEGGTPTRSPPGTVDEDAGEGR